MTSPPALTPSTSSEPSGLHGRTQPRIFTSPLIRGDAGPCGCGCPLTPETSYGFDVIDFARDVLETPLDPWQRWLVIHGGELLPDGRPRFRRLLVMVARQNGKTFLLMVLALYWLFVERQKLVLGLSTKRETAIDSWQVAVDEAETNEWLLEEVKRVIHSNGRQALETTGGAAYKVAAANRKAGRGGTIYRLIMDELREQQNRETYNAAVPAMNAVASAQMWGITNQGDDTSVILNELRDAAIRFLERGEGDKRLGIFEWSAPQGSYATDEDALCQANPGIGYRIDIENIQGEAINAQIAGGKQLADFRTEVMCQRVHVLDPAIDPDNWARYAATTPTNLAEHADKLVLCLDVNLESSHATLLGAARIDGKIHVRVVRAWEGYGCLKIVRNDLPDLVADIRPRKLGWFPKGPAAAIAANLEVRKGNKLWPPRGVVVEELSPELEQICMGLAEQVDAGEIIHPNDPLLNQHVQQAQKLRRQETWVMTRKGSESVDAAYALAGAVYLARTLARRRGPLEIA